MLVARAPVVVHAPESPYGSGNPMLSAEALAFLAGLHERFEGRRKELLAARSEREARWRAGEKPDFLPQTQAIRTGDWRCAPVPEEVADRRVEITGPVDRKMVINALNSGAKVFMADFEDSTAPTWPNVVAGQQNLYDAVRRTISFEQPGGKRYELNAATAILMVRPRGLHLEEKHLTYENARLAGALADFGLYLFHNASELLSRGSRPYYYLPKLTSHLEARFWADVIAYSEEALGLAKGTIRVTVLIETLPASFELNEILYELKDWVIGLNCGRWDYIFSYIKCVGNQPWALLPDRAQVGMTTHFLRSYSQLVIDTCHRRGVHAMGGMAAQIPIKDDTVANEAALGKVKADKEREAGDGHDGTWVAHPGLIPIALEVFDRLMPGPNQHHKRLPELSVTAADLLTPPSGPITEAGLRNNLDVALQYIHAWLGGNGCVPIYNLMEDAATAEIARAQVWQWLQLGAKLEDGRLISAELVKQLRQEEAEKLSTHLPADSLARAVALLDTLVFTDSFIDFLTLPAYEQLA